jgi:hypothetical protein
MKHIRRIIAYGAGGLIALLLLLTVGGLFFPIESEMARTRMTLDFSAAELFPYFNTREGQQRVWSQASTHLAELGYPPMEIVHLGGPEEGVGARMGFYPDEKKIESLGGTVGSAMRGTGIILESESPHTVVYEIDFGIVTSYRTVTFESVGDQSTRVDWLEELRIPNPLMRWMTLAIGDSTSDNFSLVLQALGEVAEEDHGARTDPIPN